MLDLVEKTLDQRPFPVAPGVIRPWGLAAFARWDHRRATTRDDEGDERIGIITPISDDILTGETTDQRPRLGKVMLLAPGEPEAQRITQRIDTHMNLGAEPAPTTAQRLRRLTTVFLTPQPHTDGRGRPCCRPSRSPCPGHRQNGPSCVPKHRGHTSEQSVYRRCSSYHTQRVATATVHRSVAPTTPLQQSGGTHFLAQRKREGKLVGIPGPLSIDRHVMLSLS